MDADAQFLDGSQYTSASIRVYELVYGKDFVSPGGRDTALSLSQRLQLSTGERVLDIGCGLGGASFLMAQRYAVDVVGIDLSHNMIDAASQRLHELGIGDRVTIRHGDCMEMTEHSAFDALYSRDVFLHIHDKSRLFATLHRMLKPKGRLLFTDYCCGEKPWSRDFSDYVEQRRYDLHSVEAYTDLLVDAGFTVLEAEDRSAQFHDILRADIERIQSVDLEADIREKLLQDWNGKLERCTRGEQRWGYFLLQR